MICLVFLPKVSKFTEPIATITVNNSELTVKGHKNSNSTDILFTVLQVFINFVTTNTSGVSAKVPA